MDDIIELLEDHHQDVAVGLELPSDDDLLDIEEQLFIKIEGDFREYLLNASHFIIGTLEPVTAADPQSHTYLCEVAANQWDHGLSREMLPLCECSDGCYFVNEEGEVGLWQNQQVQEEKWDSVWDWAQQVWLYS